MDGSDFVNWLEQLTVVVNDQGHTKRLPEAMASGIEPSILFIRKDNWVLGAPEEYAQTAYELWEDEWTHFFRFPDNTPHPIQEWDSSDDTN